MSIGRLNHVGIATPSIEKSVEMYVNLMGATTVHDAFDLPPQGVRVCFVATPNSQIELIEPLAEHRQTAKLLAKTPQDGHHHVCFEVADTHVPKAELEAQGSKRLGHARIRAHGRT